MNKKVFHSTLVCGALLMSLPGSSLAHFGMVIPEQDHATQKQKELQFNLSFSHPLELVGMDMEKPKQFNVMVNGKVTDLTDTLESAVTMDHQAWKTTYPFKRPGVYHFLMEPKPYWEPGEDVFIIHYTKTIIGAFGGDTEWDTPVGSPVEIVPLTRPFGNYAGNTFSGQVLVDGKPAPGIEVEVELYNKEKLLSPPTDYHITQVVKTDQNGVFNFSSSTPGWLGFSALTSAEYTLPTKDGVQKEVELGGVLWIYLAPTSQ